MKKILLCLLIFAPACCFGQFKIAVKAGLNFANITDKAGINANSRTGYMIGGYISSKPKFFGFRSEIMLSRQGYDYSSNTNTGKVNLDYLLLPQLITLNFTKKVQLHAGLQAAFLLNAKVDSSGNANGSLFDYFNRFDYGVVAGGEISPIGGLFIGARLNVSLNNVNKEEAPPGGSWPNYLPRLNVKNNVAQVYVGWRL
ncbi:MAG: porin family protein [Chitinophagaceae bacterium]